MPKSSFARVSCAIGDDFTYSTRSVWKEVSATLTAKRLAADILIVEATCLGSCAVSIVFVGRYPGAPTNRQALPCASPVMTRVGLLVLAQCFLLTHGFAIARPPVSLRRTCTPMLCDPGAEDKPPPPAWAGGEADDAAFDARPSISADLQNSDGSIPLPKVDPRVIALFGACVEP